MDDDITVAPAPIEPTDGPVVGVTGQRYALRGNVPAVLPTVRGDVTEGVR